jgi:DNA-binding SARP family transcriptional activator
MPTSTCPARITGPALRLLHAGEPDAVLTLPEPPPAAVALAHAEANDAEHGVAAGCHALDRAIREADPAGLALAHSALGVLAAQHGDPDAALRHHRLAIETPSGDPLVTELVAAHAAACSITQGAPEHALSIVDVSTSTLSTVYRGWALLTADRVDAAIDLLRAAANEYRRAGSAAIALPLALLGRAYADGGRLELAATCYEQAARTAARHGRHRLAASALAGLATVRRADDLPHALALAGQALAAPGPAPPDVVLAAGWVEVAAGQVAKAAALAERAAAAASAVRDHATLAGAMELRAVSGHGPTDRARTLAQAGELWRLIGRRSAVDRNRRAAAVIDGSAGPVTGTLPAGLLDRACQLRTGTVRIHTLGGFDVRRDGVLVDLTVYRSRKARDLLRVLVVHRERRTRRETLCGTLWPGEDPARCLNRLSVALSVVRTALDPDRLRPPDHFVVADRDTVGLRNVAVDMDEFVDCARRALDAHGDARLALAVAESLYTGDFLPEDGDAEFVIGTRAEAARWHRDVLRQLASALSSAGEHRAAVRTLYRLLDHDHYDEDSHLRLVRALTGAGRHGEACERYRAYVDRMTELGVRAAGFPTAQSSPPWAVDVAQIAPPG